MDVNTKSLHLVFITIIQLANILIVNGGPVELYVGSNSPPEGSGSGITIFQESQQFVEYVETGAVFAQSPTFLILNSVEDKIYAVNELGDYDMESGAISVFKINPGGNLTQLATVPILGSRPCHLTLDPSEKFLLTASYSTGNVEVYALLEDGTFGSRTSNVYAPTGDPNMAHAHMVTFDPTLAHVAVAFLGLDAIYFYNLDQNGLLKPYQVTASNGSVIHVRANVAPGTGPRHLVYSHDGRFFYVIGELGSTITVFDAQLDEVNGVFTPLQTVSTHPAGYVGNNSASEVAIHPNGVFLYSADRADDTIGTFSIDAETGFLMALFFQTTSGNKPRQFTIDPTGKALYAGNQDSNNIDVFEINDDGSLTPRYTIEDIPTPAVVLYKQLSDALITNN